MFDNLHFTFVHARERTELISTLGQNKCKTKRILYDEAITCPLLLVKIQENQN